MVVSSRFVPNPTRRSGYSTVSETLSIVSIDPAIAGSRVSPSQEVMAENSFFTKDFDYTTNPGSVTYIGDRDIVVDCHGAVTVAVATNNVLVMFQWVKNGVVGGSRFLSTYVSTQASNQILPDTRRFLLSKGDYLDLFFGADTITTIDLEKAEYHITGVVEV